MARIVSIALTIPLGAVFCAWGCAGPGLEAGFDAPDQSARLHAAVQAGRDNDRSQIYRIVPLLESDDPAERFIAIGVLSRMTGGDMGYDPQAGPSQRRTAVEAWRRAFPAPAPTAGDSPPRAPSGDVGDGA